MQVGNTQERLFPGLQGDGDVPTVQGRNVPGIVKKSENSHVLTISTNTNTGTMLNTETNNIPLKAGMYAGGIVGYCEKNSNLIIKNCKNAGNISYADSGSDRSVLLEVYAKSDEIGKKSIPDEGKNIEMHLVGGIISVNLENQVIDHCTNTGSMSGYSGIGGVVGLNAGLIYKCTLSEHFGNAALNYLAESPGSTSDLTAAVLLRQKRTRQEPKPAQQTSDTVPEQSKAAVRSRPKPSLETAVLAALSDGSYRWCCKAEYKLCKYHGIRKLRRRDRRKKQRNDPDSG